MSEHRISASEREKMELEHQAAKIFMRWYEKTTGHKIRHIWHNKPIKPDVSCRLNGARLDLEIAHLYASEKEAMAILGRQLTAETRKALKSLEEQSNIQDRLLEALQRILKVKAQKRYKTKKVWLIIRNAHAEWTSDLMLEQLDHLSVPDNHPFEMIWLIRDFNGSSGVFQLYPKKQTALTN